MLNQAVLVGRLVKDPELHETESGNNVTSITLAVPRNFKNDFISCVLWKGVAENTATYVKKGDLVGVKGHLQTRNMEFDNEVKRNITEVVAEKVTFLSSNRNKEEN